MAVFCFVFWQLKSSGEMKRFIVFWGLCLCFPVFIQGQSGTLSGGGEGQGPGGSFSASLGQTAFLAANANGYQFREGLQQNYEWFSLRLEPQIPGSDLKAFPNPVTEFLWLQQSAAHRSNWQYRLYNAQGQIQARGQFHQLLLQIDLSPLAAGNYVLFLESEGQAGRAIPLQKISLP